KFLAVVLGILKAGGAWLPLDPGHPEVRLHNIVTRAGCRHAVVSAAHASKLTGASGLQCVTLETLTDGAETASSGDPCGIISPQQLAYVIFTSGSTGQPKGVMIHHRGLLNHLLAKVDELSLSARDTVVQNASQCFDISVWQLLNALIVGGTVRIVPEAAAKDPFALCELLQDPTVTVFETVPLLLRSMVDVLAREHRAPPGLRWLLVTGESVPPELCRDWLALYPHIPLVNAYGPAECSDDVTHCFIERPPDTSTVPIGKALRNTRLYVLDRRGYPLPPHVPGELYIGGVGVGRGYLAAPSLTAAAFVPDPFADEPGARLYRTGDRARFLEDGTLEFLGRFDHQVKVRGYRIELGEIESVLRVLPEVRKAAAMVQEHAQRGKILAAFVVAGSPTVDLEARLRAHLVTRLPAYMVPDAIAVLDEFPVNASGKLDRDALPVLEPSERTAHVAPQTDVQAQLAAIWSDTLGVARLGIHTSFFELGGDSLIAAKIASRIRDRLGHTVRLSQLFKHPTIAGLAALLAPGQEPGPSEAVAATTERTRAALARAPPGEIALTAPGAPALDGHRAHITAGKMRFCGPLDQAALARAVADTWRRQPALRTVVNAAGALEVRDDVTSPNLEQRSLTHCPPSEREEALAQIAMTWAEQPFAPGQSLAHLGLVRLAQDHHVLVFHLHRAIADGWSDHVFAEDVWAHYCAALADEPAHLPPIAERGPAAPSGEEIARAASFWATYLALAPAPLKPRPATVPAASSQGCNAHLRRVLHASWHSDLVQLGVRAGVTANTLYLTGLGLALARVTERSDLVINNVFSTRASEAEQRRIGCYARCLPVRLQLAGTAQPGPVLARVAESVAAVYEHQRVDPRRLPSGHFGAHSDRIRAALDQVLLFHHRPAAAPQPWRDMVFCDEELETELSDFALTVHVTEQVPAAGDDDAVRVVVEYQPEVLDGAWVARLADGFIEALRHLAAGADVSVAMEPKLEVTTQAPILRAVPRDELMPASHAQTRLWLLAHLV
ncbi:MAG: amino acid adenylation domain-containing protein, partial [Myxococcota bacterium]